jgi:hypothetical protein
MEARNFCSKISISAATGDLISAMADIEDKGTKIGWRYAVGSR